MGEADWHRRVTVPRRETILAELATTNRRLAPLFYVWPVLIVVALLTTRWSVLLGHVVATCTVSVVVAGPLALSAVLIAGRSHKWVEDLAPGKQIGMYTRERLLELVAEVHRRMGLTTRTPVAITPDKDLNASAVRFGLASIFPRLNAVYIHRPMLHVLDEAELMSVVGHELAHYHRHAVWFSRATLLHLVTDGAVALWLMSWLPFGPGLKLVAIALTSQAYGWWVGRATLRHLAEVEFLCDDTGAQVAGWVPAMQAEVKLALDGEATLRAHRDLLKHGGDVPVAALLAAWQQAMPYGRVDEEELRRRMREAVHTERDKRRGLSLRGYLEFISGEDEDAEKDTRAAILSEPSPGQLLDWDRAGFLARQGLDVASAEAMVDAMRRRPNQLAFAVPWDEGEIVPGGTHPTPTRRVIYLWENRHTIEAEAKAVLAGPA